MKKKFLAMLTLVAALLTIPTLAMCPRVANIFPDIEFSGSEATCYVTVMGENSNDQIEAEIELKQGSKTVASWSEEASGILIFEASVEVTTGKSYTLYADVTIDGVKQPTVTCTKTH